MFSFYLEAGLQSTTALIDCEKLSVNGLKYHSSKDDILKVFGNPQQTFEPNYDCGFLSKADDALHFTFKNNKLIKIKYWSPC